jgi:hypothetical protein
MTVMMMMTMGKVSGFAHGDGPGEGFGSGGCECRRRRKRRRRSRSRRRRWRRRRRTVLRGQGALNRKLLEDPRLSSGTHLLPVSSLRRASVGEGRES